MVVVKIRQWRRASHLFDGDSACQGPQVRVRNPRELLLNRLQQIPGNLQPGVRAVGRLRLKPADMKYDASATYLQSDWPPALNMKCKFCLLRAPQ